MANGKRSGTPSGQHLLFKFISAMMHSCKPTARGEENTWHRSRKGNLRRRKKGFPWGSVGKRGF